MRAPPLLLLLMAAAGLAVSPLARLNPWLSACDLEDGGASEARTCGGAAACGGGGGITVTSKHPPLSPESVQVVCNDPNPMRHLKNLRLRACCERFAVSALDRSARADVQAGGEICERTLWDLLRLDEMVERVQCDFATILERYDCDQPYSMHTCQECQETYRRWACSTMIPLWVEKNGEDGEPEGSAAAARARRAMGEHATRWRARHLERVGHLDRRRGGGGVGSGGGVVGRWVRAAAAGPGRPIVRLKPCLSICQLVEQHCPYFLPADRAPAYPTQYAGEPTFLCLDPRIPETGGQANNSNYGPNECCYVHCKNKLCTLCDVGLSEPARRPAPESCAAVEERVPGCAVPYQAPSAGLRARAPPMPAPALAALLLLLHATRTHWTAHVPIVNVRDTKL